MFFSLPKIPDLAELQSHTPAIAPLAPDVSRPFWSVMIPAYNCVRTLRRTLASVLTQDPGPKQMQIEVVDDCSTKDNPEEVVRELGKGRVAFFRQPSNQGLTRNFNTCIERAQGRWVHILHGDDLVLPAYYDAYRAVIERNPAVVMVCGQVVQVDAEERWTKLLGTLPEPGTDLIPDFLARQTQEQLGQFAGIVVRRDAYEKVGGFCSVFSHVADWDMWFRVGEMGPVASTERPYSLYRVHGGSDTSRLSLTATNIRETYLLSQINLARLGDRANRAEAKWRRQRLAQVTEQAARRMRKQGLLEGCLNNARWACMLQPTLSRLLLFLRAKLSLQFRPARGTSTPPPGGAAPASPRTAVLSQ